MRWWDGITKEIIGKELKQMFARSRNRNKKRLAALQLKEEQLKDREEALARGGKRSDDFVVVKLYEVIHSLRFLSRCSRCHTDRGCSSHSKAWSEEERGSRLQTEERQEEERGGGGGGGLHRHTGGLVKVAGCVNVVRIMWIASLVSLVVAFARNTDCNCLESRTLCSWTVACCDPAKVSYL